MIRRELLRLGLSCGFICLGTLSSLALKPGDRPQANREAILSALTRARVVYLGETHDSAADHQAQLEIIQSLYRSNPQLAIGLEMFQRPAQQALDNYLLGKLTETELQVQSQYNQRWGFAWEFYAPILRFARQHQLPLIALNTPTEVIRKVARGGLERLTPEDQQYIPPIGEIDTSNGVYRQKIQQAYQDHQGHGHSSLDFDYFFQAQVLWDETMAEAIAQFLQANPEHQVIVLAGVGHIAYGHGIPSRVARRMEQSASSSRSPLIQYSIILNPDTETQNASGPPAADFFWITD